MRTFALIVAVALAALPARAQFYEGFDGSFENAWNTFPFPNEQFNDPPFFLFAGFPGGTFEPIAGADVFRMTNTFPVLHYVGMSPAYVMDGSEGIIEVRINTMGDEFVPTDGVFNLRVLSPGGESLTLGFYTSGPSSRRVYRQSTLDGTNGVLSNTTYDPLTWYRLRLDNTGATLKGQVLTDSGHLLYQYDFGHSLADMQVSGPGLYLAIVQHGFSSPEFVNADISIDFLKVSPGCPADLAQPFGVLDLADINAFTGGFTLGSPIGDLDGNGILDLADIGLFIASFTAGCP